MDWEVILELRQWIAFRPVDHSWAFVFRAPTEAAAKGEIVNLANQMWPELGIRSVTAFPYEVLSVEIS